MWTFLEVFICGNKFYVFTLSNSLTLSKALQVKLCFTLWFIIAYCECKREEFRRFQLF